MNAKSKVPRTCTPQDGVETVKSDGAIVRLPSLGYGVVLDLARGNACRFVDGCTSGSRLGRPIERTVGPEQTAGVHDAQQEQQQHWKDDGVFDRGRAMLTECKPAWRARE